MTPVAEQEFEIPISALRTLGEPAKGTRYTVRVLTNETKIGSDGRTLIGEPFQIAINQALLLALLQIG